MAANPLEAVAKLHEVIKQLAPALSPQVLPKGFDYGLDVLLSVCATETQKVTLRKLVDQHSKAQTDTTPCITGSFDVEKKVFAIESIVWLDDVEFMVHAFPRFLEYQLNEPDKAQNVISTFLERNGHNLTDIMTAQQCFNTAFALQTILRAFPRPNFSINGDIINIDEKTDIENVVGFLLKKTKKENATVKVNTINSETSKKKHKKRRAQ